MSKQVDLLQGTLDMLILKAVSLGGLHGYGVLLRLQQLTGGRLQIQQGSLYPALYRLEYKGLITSEWGESENKRRAKFYSLRFRPQATEATRSGTISHPLWRKCSARFRVNHEDMAPQAVEADMTRVALAHRVLWQTLFARCQPRGSRAPGFNSARGSRKDECRQAWGLQRLDELRATFGSPSGHPAESALPRSPFSRWRSALGQHRHLRRVRCGDASATVRDPSRLVFVQRLANRTTALLIHFFELIRDQATSFEAVGAFSPSNME
jgi:transcriptional regulator